MPTGARSPRRSSPSSACSRSSCSPGRSSASCGPTRCSAPGAHSAASSALAQATYAERPEVQAFILQMVERQGFVEGELNKLFSKVQRADPILTAIQQPAEKVRAWPEYRATFLSEERIAAGAAFWRAHGK